MNASRRKAAAPTRRSGFSLTGRGERIALRAMTEDDIEALAAWYHGARELRGWLEEGDGGVLAITSRADGAPVGAVEYRVDEPAAGWLSFETVAVEPRLRGLGLESEAVRQLEGEMASRGRASRYCAWADREDGLSLYFWLRLGYRPAGAGDDISRGEGAGDRMAMIRTPANQEPRTKNRR